MCCFDLRRRHYARTMLRTLSRQTGRHGLLMGQWMKQASVASAHYSISAGGGSLSSTIKLSNIPAPHKGEIAIVSLNRPKARNAINTQLLGELNRVVEQLHSEGSKSSTRALILASESDDAFCAGADLESAFRGGEERPSEHRDGGGRVALAVQRCRKPIIGALQGSAVGIGITMTLPMSIRIAYEGAKIGFVFARRGLVMEACSSYYLPRLIG